MNHQKRSGNKLLAVFLAKESDVSTSQKNDKENNKPDQRIFKTPFLTTIPVHDQHYH